MTDEARAVPVEGDRERLAALLTDYVPAHALRQCAEHLLRAGVSPTGSGLDVERLARAMTEAAPSRPGIHAEAEAIAHEYAALSGESGEPTGDVLEAAYEALRGEHAALRDAAQEVVTRWFDWIDGEADQTLRASMIRLRAALSGESGEPTYEAVLAAMVAHDEGEAER